MRSVNSLESEADLRYHDISPLISEKIAVFPGDQPFSRGIALDFQAGDHLLVSHITSTLHLGAHADASNHYHASGTGIEQRSLDCYLGDCQVIEVNCKPSARIDVQDLKGKAVTAPRVIFKTRSFPDPNCWCDDFNSLSPELIDWLAQKKVKLVGLDTPSVDPHDSKKLESHARLYANSMAVLEGLFLPDVPEGVYTLVALPLRLKDCDASPVRAILLEKSHDSVLANL